MPLYENPVALNASATNDSRPWVFYVYMDASEAWRWRLVAGTGEIVACSGQSFYDFRAAHAAAEHVQKYTRNAALIVARS